MKRIIKMWDGATWQTGVPPTDGWYYVKSKRAKSRWTMARLKLGMVLCDNPRHYAFDMEEYEAEGFFDAHRWQGPIPPPEG